MKKVLYLILVLAAVSCSGRRQGLDLADPSAFSDYDGEESVTLYTLRSGGLVMQVTNFGARVVSLYAPDRDGKMGDVVLGHATLQEYVHPVGERFLGACVGPVANRIGGASFTVDGAEYSTPKNDNEVNTLHGGFIGVDNLVWDVLSSTDSSLTLHLLHPDGLEGYPGNLDMTMEYSLSGNDFIVTYSAVTDKATPVNFSHHPFFNLGGPSVESYLMTINADRYTPIDALSIPTGELAPVEGTPFDFRTEHAIGERIGEDDVQLRNARGYDHNWCLLNSGDGLESACTVYDPSSGRQLEVLTDQVGLQFYSGNFFDGTTLDRHGRPMTFRGSLALEAQKYPDSPNHEGFTDVILRPGETYTQKTVYRFSVR